MKLWIRWAAPMALSLFSIAANAAPTCTSYTSAQLKRAVAYCVHRARPDVDPSADEPVVYFFHGLRGSANSWISKGYAQAVDQLASEENYPAVTFVSFDTEAGSFFSDHAGRADGRQSYEIWFVREFMPHIERMHKVCAKRECRATAGYSMGGLGALKTALRFPNLFAATAGNSAALSPFNAYDAKEKWKSYFDRHPIGRFKGKLLMSHVKKVFTSPEQFDDHDPSVLVTRVPLDRMPKLYFDVGDRDDFGFSEGFERLRRELIAQGVAFESELVPGADHDAYRTQRFPLLRWIRDRGLANLP